MKPLNDYIEESALKPLSRHIYEGELDFMSEEFEKNAASAFKDKKLKEFWSNPENVNLIVKYISNNKPIKNYSIYFDNAIGDAMSSEQIVECISGVWNNAAKSMYSTSNFGFCVIRALYKSNNLKPGDLDKFICINTVASTGMSTKAVDEWVKKTIKSNMGQWQYAAEVCAVPNLSEDAKLDILKAIADPGSSKPLSAMHQRQLDNICGFLRIENLPLNKLTNEEVKWLAKGVMHVNYESMFAKQVQQTKNGIRQFIDCGMLPKLTCTKLEKLI